MEANEQQLDDILSSFRRVNHHFQQLIWQDAEELGVTSTQLMVLRKIAMNPDIGITELAELLYLGNSSASGMVDRMVKAGLITRERSEADKRSIKLALTGKGQEIRERSIQSVRRRLKPLTELPEEDVQELLRLHKHIIYIIEQGRAND